MFQFVLSAHPCFVISLTLLVVEKLLFVPKMNFLKKAVIQRSPLIDSHRSKTASEKILIENQSKQLNRPYQIKFHIQ